MAVQGAANVGDGGRNLPGLNAPLDDNDDTERHALGPGVWMQVQLKVRKG